MRTPPLLHESGPGRQWLCGALLMALGTACNNAPPERFNTFPVATVLSPSTFCSGQAQSACDYASRCDPADRQVLDAAGDCLQAATQRCLRTYAVQMAAVETQRSSWVSRAGERCLGALAGRACDSEVPPPCQGMFAGAGQQGSTCFFDSECAEGMTCSSNGLSCGMCLRRVTLYDPNVPELPTCGPRRPCQHGLRCQAGQCLEPGNVGDGCGSSEGICAEGLGCVVTEAGRICLRLMGNGSSCTKAGCRPGLSCVEANAARTCMPLALEGGACNASSVGNPPCEGEGVRLACVSGRCEAINILQSGAPCGDGARCGGELACVAGQCVSRPKAGDACGQDGGPDLCLESSCVGGVCRAPSVAGETCTDGCQGLHCIGGHCGTTSCDAGILPDAGRDGGAP